MNSAVHDPIKILAIDISEPLKDYRFDNKYRSARILFRWKEKPLFDDTLPFINGELKKEYIAAHLLEKHSRHLYLNYLDNEIIKTEQTDSELPFISVAVCTRNRSESLENCLNSLKTVDYKNFEILVVDNAPDNESTKELVLNKFKEFRYVREEKPGLDWARNRAIEESKGDIVAYTDDDVEVDKYWLAAIGKAFVKNPDVMAVTGLVTPLELETESQILFEEYGGFSRGFSTKYINVKEDYKKRWKKYGTGQYGTGANMAFRKSVFEKIGKFDPALDVGTVTNGGGDLDMFFRVLKYGMTLLYQPGAIVFHHHRREYAQLRDQIRNNGIGLYSFLTKNFLKYPEERLQILKLAIYWMFYWNLRRSISALFKPAPIPKDLIWGELKGSFIGFKRYFKSKKNAAKLGFEYKREKENHTFDFQINKNKIGVHIIEFTEPISVSDDFAEYNLVKVIVKHKNSFLGDFYVPKSTKILYAESIKQSILNSEKILQSFIKSNKGIESEIEIIKSYYSSLKSINPNKKFRLSEDQKVTVLICTLDRPADLRNSLQSIFNQKTDRKFEIVVVDNNPKSKLTTELLKEFPQVNYVPEFRKGLAAARNAGIRKSAGDIILITDDDIVAPSDWLENMLSNFSNSNVDGVCGNVVPHKMDSISQILFEAYGALSKGYQKKSYDHKWLHQYRFKAVPTWEIGATANFAFRKRIFENDPKYYFLTTLGAGTPASVGEDTFLFYQMLKNNFKIVYDPSAYIRHKHRETIKSLINQIFNYSKGHVGYHLETLFREKDFRALVRIFVELPLAHVQRIIASMRGKSSYTILLLSIEIAGNLIGPFSYLRSILKDARLRKKYRIPPNTKDTAKYLSKVAALNK